MSATVINPRLRYADTSSAASFVGNSRASLYESGTVLNEPT